MANKAPSFGGGYIDFTGRKETVEQVLGSKPNSTEMIKNLWAFIKKNELQKKGK